MLSRPTSLKPKPWIRALHYIWAFPNTLIGLNLGILGLLTGGKCHCEQGCLEFHGGLIIWLLTRTHGTGGFMAMTLGHVIVGQNQNALNIARDHEHVHVRQYERWGPFFIPAYLGCSAYLWLKNKEAYRGNPFEVEAYRFSDPEDPSANSAND